MFERATERHDVGIEKSFKILNIGEHQAVLQWLVYHVGFTRKPLWLDD